MNIKQKIGIVIGGSHKTKTVLVQSRQFHKKYKKIILTNKRYLTHDEQNIAKMDDIVKIESCAPISKYKTYKLVNIIKTI